MYNEIELYHFKNKTEKGDPLQKCHLKGETCIDNIAQFNRNYKTEHKYSPTDKEDKKGTQQEHALNLIDHNGLVENGVIPTIQKGFTFLISALRNMKLGKI